MAGTAAKLEKYLQLFINFLPKGRFWQPSGQPVFLKFLRSSAQEFCRVDDRVKQMISEVDPNKPLETLDQWEGMLGIPDECTPKSQILGIRRNQIVQKLTNTGGLSKTFYEFIGKQLGFDIKVENHLNFVAGRARAGDSLTNYFNRHFVAGSLAGSRLTEIGWRFYFNVEMPVTASGHFVAGSVAGTPIRTFANPLIECTMQKLKPAHSGVTFTFKE